MIRRRLEIARQKKYLEKMWKENNIKTKKAIIQSCIFSIAMYTCDA